jgi:putative ABC transport system permease protein
MLDVGIPTATSAWEAGQRPDLTITELDGLVGELACRDGSGSELGWCAGGGRPLVPGTQAGPFRDRTVADRGEADFVERFLGSSLPFVIDRARATQTSVAAGIWATAALAAIAGGGLVAAATSLWYERRRRELVLLSVRGVSPAALGVKACLELVLPLLVGTSAGILLAYGSVTLLGPSPIVEPRAVRQALFAAGAALVVSTLTIGGVVTLRARPMRPHHALRVRLGALPWELPLIALTAVSYDRLGEWGVPVGRGADLSRVDLWGLLFPVLFLVTVVAVASRILTWGVRPLRRASGRWPTALYLGVRRIARHRVAAIGLVAASAVSAGVLAYAATMNRALDATLEAKGQMFVGADVATQVPDDVGAPDQLTDTSTSVRDYPRAWLPGAARVSVRVLAIDPATFARAAFWDESLADRSLEDLLDALSAPATEGRVPAIVVGTDVEPRTALNVQGDRRMEVELEPIEGVDSFPGMRLFEPTVYVADSALDVSLDGFDREVWFRGEHDAVIDALDAADISYQERRSFAGIADRGAFHTVSWTFGFLQSLGIAAGLLVLGSVAVYLDARRRHRLLGYTFMRRMGLTARQHRCALGVELAASVVVGAWLGLGIAITGAMLAHGRIDPVPLLLPGPLLRVPVGAVLGLAALSALLTVVAVIRAQQRIDADDPLEVIRAGA